MCTAGCWRISSSMGSTAYRRRGQKFLSFQASSQMVMASRTPSSSTTCCDRDGSKVALLVEDVVERQQALVLLEQQTAAIQQNGGIHGRLMTPAAKIIFPRSRLLFCGKGHARQHGGRQIARCRGQLIDGRTAAGQEAWFFKEVGWRVPADDQFGKDGQPRAQCGRATAGGNDFFKISGEIPDRWIDLGQCDLHISSLILRGKVPPFALHRLR